MAAVSRIPRDRGIHEEPSNRHHGQHRHSNATGQPPINGAGSADQSCRHPTGSKTGLPGIHGTSPSIRFP